MSLFVTFEGPEGAGKSTQIHLVAKYLRSAGQDVLVTREPGGTSLGEAIRTVLLASTEIDIVPRSEALLMTAARAQHVAEVIRPALTNGRIVLCDRFVDSTLAYQGAGRGLNVEDLESLQRFAIDDLRPDLTVLLDLPVMVGLARREQSGVPMNRLDRDDRAFHERVRAWYVQAAQESPDRWIVVDAEASPEELAEIIGRNVLERAEPQSVTRRGDGNEA